MNLKRNVILLVVESLSSYQSKYFSGLPFDNLKEFDKSLKDASSLSFKYRCSSFNTLTNLFSLLTGYYPLLRPQGKIDYSSDKYYAHSISAEFKREGYHTVMFLPVRFVDNLDVVSEKCDFDTVIDDKDPFFNNAERYIFNGVDDSVAFKRLVNLTEELKSNPKPHFIFMKTTTMHAPYVDPVTQTYSFEATVQFFDRAYKDFMNDLKASGYFDRGGVLVVTGDHRAMVPMGSQEQMRYGVWAIQKVPLVFFGQNLKPVDDKNEYNHVDLHFSLQYLMLNRAWKNRLQKNMFAPEQNQSFTCAFFQQCFNPAEVLLDTSVGEGKIVLNGDKTRIKCPNLTREQTKLIESYLVWVRAR
jgi:phosphoglycerol transferase MdoB-like AlkP superfamily enzyme